MPRKKATTVKKVEKVEEVVEEVVETAQMLNEVVTENVSPSVAKLDIIRQGTFYNVIYNGRIVYSNSDVASAERFVALNGDKYK